LSRLPYPLIFRYARCSKGSFDINLGHLPRSLGMNLSRSLEPVIQSEFLEIHRSLTSTLRSTEREKAQGNLVTKTGDKIAAGKFHAEVFQRNTVHVKAFRSATFLAIQSVEIDFRFAFQLPRARSILIDWWNLETVPLDFH
ncbi:hypothetical protein Moror_3425, partial [Moniliophthora roreri MCA 2997]